MTFPPAPDRAAAAIHRRDWRREAPFMLAVAALAFALYAATAPHAVMLEDDALFIGNLHFWGIGHPPGYPAHTLLGGVFYHLLPFGTPAYKAHLFSGVCGAAACAAVYAVTRQLESGRLAALIAALAFMASHTFWSQAIVAEVYTLNALLFFLLLALALHHRAGGGQNTIRAAAVVCGVALAAHYPLFLLAAAPVLLHALAGIRGAAGKLRAAAAGGGIALAVASVFYLWMIWRSYDDMPAHFYGLPFDSVEQFLHYVLRTGYAAADNEPGVTWHDKWLALQFIAGETATQFTPAGAAFALAGAIILLRRREQRGIAAALLASVFCVSVLLIVLRDFKADYLGLAVFRVYHLTSYGIIAILLAIGVCGAAASLARGGSARRGGITSALGAALIIATLATHWRDNNLRDENTSEALARAKLDSVDANAVLFVSGDFDLPLGYLHYIKGERPDLTVLNADGLIYGAPLFTAFTPATAEDGGASRTQVLRRFSDNSIRPIYFPPHLTDLFQGEHRHSDHLGFFRRLNNAPTNRIQLAPATLAWLQAHLDDMPADRWRNYENAITAHHLVSAALAAQWSGNPLTPAWHDIIERARQRHLGIDTAIAAHALSTDTLTDAQQATYLDRCAMPGQQVRDEVEPTTKSAFHLFCARLNWQVNGDDNPDGERHLRAALAQPLRSDNPALTVAMRRHENAPCRLAAIADTFADAALPDDITAQLQTARAACASTSTPTE